jgi:MtfA peptidase
MLRRNLSLYRYLPAEDRGELEGHIQVFLAEKRFEGCDGLSITDEIRGTVAAQACLLLLHRDTDYYPGLRSIVIYPSAYTAEETSYSDHGVVTERQDHRLGESWESGAVVLAWDSVLHGAADASDGHNVALHEFAHQLDQEDGVADGAPVLDAKLFSPERQGRYLAWARILSAEFERLQQEVHRGQSTVLDAYGATNPAEFFAVATECFFEQPQKLLKKRPELYEQLRKFYRQDPVLWKPDPESGSR